MHIFDCKRNNKNELEFIWIEDGSGKETILKVSVISSRIRNLFDMLRFAMTQFYALPVEKRAACTFGPVLANLLDTVPKVKISLTNWLQNLNSKSLEESEAELEAIHLWHVNPNPYNQDSKGFTPLHKAIMNKNIPEIHRLLGELSFVRLQIKDSYETLNVVCYIDSIGLRKERSGKGSSYIKYLVENLSFEEFKQIWKDYSVKLEKIPCCDTHIVDFLFRNEEFDYANFLVEKGYSLDGSGQYKGVKTFDFSQAFAKANPLEYINRYLQILEKQSDKISSKEKLKSCFFELVDQKNNDIMLSFLKHPYVIKKQKHIDFAIKRAQFFVREIPCFSDPQLWEYFLDRIKLNPQNLEQLVSSAIENNNLAFLLYLENKKLYELKGIDLATATKFQVPNIITHLIVEKKIDPSQIIENLEGGYPFCAIPQNSSSTVVIEAYVKAMGPENFCKMLLKEPKSPLSFISRDGRENSMLALAAKIYIKKNAPMSLRIPFIFGETLTSIISDESKLDLLCAAFYDESCVDIRFTLEHFIKNQETLLVYSGHKKALELLQLRLKAFTKTKILSDEGIRVADVINKQLIEADMQMNLARDMASVLFPKAEEKPKDVEEKPDSTPASWYKPLPEPVILQEPVKEKKQEKIEENPVNEYPKEPIEESAKIADTTPATPNHAGNPQTLFYLERVPNKPKKNEVWELSCCDMVLLGCVPVVGWAVLLAYAIYHSCCAPTDSVEEDRADLCGFN